jgi:hypothetical protein
MRAGRGASESGAVRVLLDIRRDGEGRIVGHVTPPAGAPVRFCGWLELLHLLEDHADETTLPDQGGRTCEGQHGAQAP